MDRYGGNDYATIEMLKKHGLLKRINHDRMILGLRRSHEFTFEEEQMIYRSRFYIQIEKD